VVVIHEIQNHEEDFHEALNHVVDLAVAESLAEALAVAVTHVDDLVVVAEVVAPHNHAIAVEVVVDEKCLPSTHHNSSTKILSLWSRKCTNTSMPLRTSVSKDVL
jgi:hypothetical protein